MPLIISFPLISLNAIIGYEFYIWFVGFYTVFFFAFSLTLVSFLKSYGPILNVFAIWFMYLNYRVVAFYVSNVFLKISQNEF